MKPLSRVRIGSSRWAAALAISLAIAGCRSNTKPVGPQALTQITPGQFAKIWQVDIGLGKAKPTDSYLFDNVIVIYADDGTSHVVDRASGRLMFINDLPRNAGTLHPPTVVGDRLIYPATSAIKIYNVKTGVLLSNFTVPYAIKTAGSGAGDHFYISADFPNGGRVVALDLNNPSPPRWELMTVAATRSKPIDFGNDIYIASEDGKVRAVTEDKQGLWALTDTYEGAFKTGGKIYANIVVDSTSVYVPSTDTKLYALNRNTGKIKWQYYAGAALLEPPSITADMLYIRVPDQGLAAMTKTEGDFNRRAKWISPEAFKFLSEDEKNAYVQLGNGHLVALDKMTGQKVFSSKGIQLEQAVTNTKDSLIYAMDDKSLVCIKPVLKQGVMGEVVEAPASDPTILASR